VSIGRGWSSSHNGNRGERIGEEIASDVALELSTPDEPKRAARLWLKGRLLHSLKEGESSTSWRGNPARRVGGPGADSTAEPDAADPLAPDIPLVAKAESVLTEIDALLAAFGPGWMPRVPCCFL